MFEAIEQIKKRYIEDRDKIFNEENTRYSLIDPFIRMILGYDVGNLNEVITQYSTGFGADKSYFVDYAIMQNDKPIILREAKKLKGKLNADSEKQLLFYFNSTDAKIGILTDGYEYRFYTDTVKPNIMDQEPFLQFTIENIDEHTQDILKRFTKSAFNVDEIISVASELKYSKEIKDYLANQLVDPNENFVKRLTENACNEKTYKKSFNMFKVITKKALNTFISDKVSERLKLALAEEKVLNKQIIENPTLSDNSKNRTSDAQILYLSRKNSKNGQIIKAKCKIISDGYVVLKGSSISSYTSDIIADKIKKARDEAKIDENGILLEDMLFASPSGASGFCVGNSSNGWTDWKTEDGRTLAEIKPKQE
ncbi:MAG: DUF4357 domain-containing protein [Candidatus Cloacimonetes bacterium]|nr:DUF4357 domain-containing protein [Candidatus Cloacimonadota bacterium]